MDAPAFPYTQYRPHPAADPGFRLNPDGTALFEVDGHTVRVEVRHTTEDDQGYPYNATAESHEVIVFASVDVAGVTVARSWMLADWHNPYDTRDALIYTLREAVADGERKVREMAAELDKIVSKREPAKEPEQLTGRALLESLRACDEYRITTGDATADEIARARSMSASSVVQLFTVALETDGRTVVGTRDRITALTREDAADGLTALRLDAAGEVISK